MKKAALIISFILLAVAGFAFSYHWNGKTAQSGNPNEITQKEESSGWAESQLQKMSLEEKIAQLLMIRVHSDYSPEILKEVNDKIVLHQPGGLCFFKGSPQKQIKLTNDYQAVSQIPMLIAIDGEWGPAMRLDSCIAFPRQMTMGAMDDSGNPLIYEMGKEVAEQCKALGIDINFAPDVDVNNNPKNPVINSRSFGENRDLVTAKSISYMKGMQDNGLSACAKHFPGHGDTGTDSHYDLPVINKSRKELDSLELYPFRAIVKEGVDMVMISHLNIPALDPEKNSIATLSYNIVTKLLKEELGFEGIIITDGMDMAGLRKSFPHGADAEIMALLAGIDILLLPNDPAIVIPGIVKAIKDSIISEELINERCLKVLKYKERMGLTRHKIIPTKDIYAKLNSDNAKQIVKAIYAKSLTLLKNEKATLPLKREEHKKMALLCIGGDKDSAYYRNLCAEYGIGFVYTPRSVKTADHQRLFSKLSAYDKVVVAVLSTNQLPKYNYGIYKESVTFINELSKRKKVILSLFGNPYALDHFDQLSGISAVVVGYEPSPMAVSVTLKALFGEASFEGKLPVTTRDFKLFSGIMMHNPEIDLTKAFSLLPQSTIQSIDSVILKGIADQVFPGCQIMAIRHGKTIFNKWYGNQTYSNLQPVNSSLLYDVASITKPAATTLAVMKLYDEKKIRLNDKIGRYLPYLAGTDKAELTIAELLTHTSGLVPYIPFYRELSINGESNSDFLSNTKSPDYSIEVAKNLYLNPVYLDTIHRRMADSKLGRKSYKYSDLGFVFLKEIVEIITEEPFEQYLNRHFYEPLGLKNCCFNPLEKEIPLSLIVPTERDTFFRKQLVHGYIHDQTTALFGGVGGNAGIFSNTGDLAVIFKMLMNGGVYDGKRYLSEATVKRFVTTYPLNGCKRRALGFDTPSFDTPSVVLPSAAARSTFGHQGFTGTSVWCDPENELIYIFLSNRIYPDTEPNKLAQSKIRVIVHELIYNN